MISDYTNSLLDSALVIAILSGLFYYFGFITDKRKISMPEWNPYIMGFLYLLACIVTPSLIFFFLHYNMGKDHTSFNFNCWISLQLIICILFLIILWKLKSQSDNEFKHIIINKIPNWVFSYNILSAFFSCLVFIPGFYYSLNYNYNPLYYYSPIDQVDYFIRLFFFWVPILLSFVGDSLIAMTFVLIEYIQENHRNSSNP
jgi:hypothetical protein